MTSRRFSFSGFRAGSLVASLPWLISTCFAAVPGPERELTDPRSVISETDRIHHPIPIADLLSTRAIRGASWSPDGKNIAVTMNMSGRYNVWRVPTDGSWPVQMAPSDDRQYGVAWSPDGEWIVFDSDHGGDEIFDIYAIPASGGEAINLTNTGDESERGALFSRDNSALAYTIHSRSESTIDIAIMDWKSRKARRLTHERTPGTTWQAIAFSPDGRFLYANRFDASQLDASIWRLAVDEAAAEQLTPHHRKLLLTATGVSADGRLLALSSNEHHDTNQVQLLDLRTRKRRDVTRGAWEANAGDFSPDSGSLAYVANVDGRGEMFLYDVATGQSRKLGIQPGANRFAGSPTAFSSDGKRLLLSHQDSTTPADYWIRDIDSGWAMQLTHSAIGSINLKDLPTSRLVHYSSFDGTVISAYLWIPKGLERNRTAPAIVIAHGGPADQIVDSFNKLATALASRGYLCIAPNFRGSLGYGNAFVKSNYKDLGGGDLQDEVYATKFLTATGYVDPKKIGITGDSYGGFMALMAIGRSPDIWAAAVDEYGPIDWQSLLQHEDPRLQVADQQLLGDPIKDRKIYERSSASTYFSAIRAPVLVLQGENDIRDPKAEAEIAVAELRSLGKTVQVHYYPGEGHGFRKRENQIDEAERIVAWFDKYLKETP
jgi:dipeptidyl aminopeptidase/acylaminoacyl peptidase